MQFHYTAPQTPIEEMMGGFYCINAIGSIAAGDDRRFEVFLKSSKPPPRCVVYIDSTGGDVDAAMGIGRLIRSSWFSTDIGRYQLDFDRMSDLHIQHRKKVSGKCLSAATLMYLGGRLRFLDDKAEFGVHQFKFPSAIGEEVPQHFLAKTQSLSARISEYIHEMGITPQFLILSAATPSEEIQIIDRATLEQIGVVTGGLTGVTWTLEANNGISYVKGERDSLFGHHKVMLCFNKEIGFAVWAVIETQGRASELLGFQLVEVVINGEEERIDIGSRAVRSEYGIYTNVFAKLSEEEAKKIAFSDSFGVQIRLSSEAQVFLGISAMDTSDGRMKLRTFFENHRS